MNPVDQLALLRQRIREMREEARALRRSILAGEVGTVGERYVARVQRRLIVLPKPEPEATCANVEHSLDAWLGEWEACGEGD